MAGKVDELLRKIHGLYSESEVKILHFSSSCEYQLLKHYLRVYLPQNLTIMPGPTSPYTCCTISELRNVATLCRSGTVLLYPSRLGTVNLLRELGNVVSFSNLAEALELAKRFSHKLVVIFYPGFEPEVIELAYSILRGEVPSNVKFYLSCRSLITFLEYLIAREGSTIRGLIFPRTFNILENLSDFSRLISVYRCKYVISSLTCCTDVLLAISSVLEELSSLTPSTSTPRSLDAVINEVFKRCDIPWFAIGEIPLSGFSFRDEFSIYDVHQYLHLRDELDLEDFPHLTHCRGVIEGRELPISCPHFNVRCNPHNPLGLPMAIPDGTCSIWYWWLKGS